MTARTMTMTMSDVRKWYVDGERSLLDFLQNNAPVTIVPDPEPRPDFASMNIVSLATWADDNRVGPSPGYDHTKAALVRLCNSIADRKGMGR